MQTQTAMNSNIDNNYSFDSIDKFPPGYLFYPSDKMLIWFLRTKVSGKQLTVNPIFEADPYAHNPQELDGAYKVRETEWYFFTQRNGKYIGENQPARAARDGYWKPTGADTRIRNKNGNTVGFKKALDFYQGGEKTEWKMHEYTLNKKSVPATDVMTEFSSMKLDDWVLCKIYKNSRNHKVDQAMHMSDPALQSENDSIKTWCTHLTYA